MNVRAPITYLVVLAGLLFAIPAVMAVVALMFIGRNFSFSVQWGRARA